MRGAVIAIVFILAAPCFGQQPASTATPARDAAADPCGCGDNNLCRDRCLVRSQGIGSNGGTRSKGTAIVPAPKE